MFRGRRLGRRVIVAAFIALCGLLSIGIVIVNKPTLGAIKNDRGYVRGVEMNREIADVLQDLGGANTISFAMKCPPGHKAVVARVVIDKDGKIIEDASHQTVGFYNEDEQQEWIFRLTKIDPGAFIENYKGGKILWRVGYRSKSKSGFWSTGSEASWDRDWYHAEGAFGASSYTGIDVTKPITGKEYTVWESTVQRVSKPDDRPGDSLVLYRYRLLVTFLKAKPGDSNSFGTHPITTKIE